MNLNCIHYNQGCSGCVLSEALSAPPIFDEVIRFFKEELNFKLNVSVGELKGWRTRAKLAVRGTPENPLVGLFKEGTHDAVDIPHCQVQHPKLNQAADVIRQWIKEQMIYPYDEVSGKGELRYLQLTLDELSGHVQVVLILNKTVSSEVLKNLWDKGHNCFQSLWINLNTGRTNVIWGDKWERIFGEEWLTINLLSKPYYFHPASFIQANPERFNALLGDVRNEIAPGKRVVEYYAGAGVIGLSIVDKVENLILSELNKTGKICFEKNLTTLPENLQKVATYHELDAKKGSYLLKEAEVVIVDPPRKGIDPALFESLIAKTSPYQLVYISCGFPSFKKESVELVKAGFKLTFAKGYLFFPGTNHIETLAIFTRI